MLRHRCYCAGVLRPTLSGAWTPGSTWSGTRPRLKVQQGVPRSSTTPSPQSTDRMAFCPSPGQAATAALSQTQFSCPGFNSLFFWSESKLVTFEADCNKIQLLWIGFIGTGSLQVFSPQYLIVCRHSAEAPEKVIWLRTAAFAQKFHQGFKPRDFSLNLIQLPHKNHYNQ